MPQRGEICIFNRSYYEDVIVTRVHPEKLYITPCRGKEKSFWNGRYDDINAFERHLVRNRTVIIKFFLHISKHEQKKRLLRRLEDREKMWKFSPADFEERKFWNDYQKAYEAALTKTSTDNACWYIIPADHKWVAHALIADIIVSRIEALGLSYPVMGAEEMERLKQIRRMLGEEEENQG